MLDVKAEGHISRNCSRWVTTCYACDVQGHIRRNCPNVRCRKCDKKFHGEKECYTNIDRMRYKQTDANTRRQCDTYNNYGQGRYDARQNEQYDRRTNERYNGRQNERYERRSNDQTQDHMEVTKDQITEVR